jgi:hypothetical protein
MPNLEILKGKHLESLLNVDVENALNFEGSNLEMGLYFSNLPNSTAPISISKNV